MSKLRPEKINFNSNDFLVELDDEKSSKEETVFDDLPVVTEKIDNKADEDAKNQEAELIIENANREKTEILNDAKKQSEEIINNANSEAEKILEKANKESLELLEKSKTELEKQITSSANEGYTAGYNDGLEKIKEELEEKLNDFDKFCSIQGEIKNKILKSASKDILNIITNISRKILLFEVNPETIEKIINNSITLLEKKEDINIILSEKYAKLLYDYQKNTLNEESELDFENFKQYKNFNIIYNPKFNDDTIIVENPYERYDASINSQLDVIVRNIFENTQNGKLEDIEENIKESTEEPAEKLENEP